MLEVGVIAVSVRGSRVIDRVIILKVWTVDVVFSVDFGGLLFREKERIIVSHDARSTNGASEQVQNQDNTRKHAEHQYLRLMDLIPDTTQRPKVLAYSHR